jgi:uncharacterized protein
MKPTQLLTSILTAAALAQPLLAAVAPTSRPPVEKRNFHSEAVEAFIAKVKADIADPETARTFENCFPNTIDTTVFYSEENGVPDTYIITGDIDAMWLRDSSAQVNHYIPLAKDDGKLAKLINGLIRRQTRYILIDPYANAFYREPDKVGEWKSDMTEMKPGVHERKWELDSLTYCIRLAWKYWKATGDTSAFDETWLDAMQLAVDTMLVLGLADGVHGSNLPKWKMLAAEHGVRLARSSTSTMCSRFPAPPLAITGMPTALETAAVSSMS